MGKQKEMFRISRLLIVTVVFLAGIGFAADNLVGKIHFIRGKEKFLGNQYRPALDYLQKAAVRLPNDEQVSGMLGKLFLALGKQPQDARNAFHCLLNSRKHYIKAIELNPLEASFFFGLARCNEALEYLYERHFHIRKPHPFDPLDAFQKAVELRPASASYHYCLARYLYGNCRRDPVTRLSSSVIRKRRPGADEHVLSDNCKALKETVRRLARIYPFICAKLKKEDIWSQEVRLAVKEGLRDAIGEKSPLREAHKAFSMMCEWEEDWACALEHFQLALSFREFENNGRSDFQLGKLLLKNKKLEPAETAFLDALCLEGFSEEKVESICAVYRGEGLANASLGLLDTVMEKYPFWNEAVVLKARTLSDLNRSKEALLLLERLVESKPDGHAFYEMARIARSNGDWDRAEIYIQKATLHDPDNGRYHLFFAEALKRAGKMDRAIEERNIAEKLSPAAK